MLALVSLPETSQAAREPVLGGPCEGCEWVFVDMPQSVLARARIAPEAEAGQPLILEGDVTRPDGQPAAGVIIYAYHTDARGLYPDGPNRHGRLRGWAKTDETGHYRFDTIRPASYPSRSVPEHIHMHVIEPGVGTYYIDEVRFTDDPLYQKLETRVDPAPRGGSGVVKPSRRAGVWHASRDIRLGLNIPDYP